MPVQFIDIKDSQVKFVNEKENPQIKVEAVEVDVATLVFESMQDKMKIMQIETELGVAVMEIMQLKLGGNQ